MRWPTSSRTSWKAGRREARRAEHHRGSALRPPPGPWRPLVALAVEGSAGPFFASGRPNRYNLHGTATLYFGEDLLTAYAETVQEAAGLLLSHPTRETPVPSLPGGWDLASEEPVVVLNVKAQIKRVLDLTDTNTRVS